jgi:uncharacterized damage-inducible protein DinB
VRPAGESPAAEAGLAKPPEGSLATRACMEPLTRELGTSHGSLRGALVPTLWSEWIWLQCWRGASPKQVSAGRQVPNVAAIRARWAEVERDRERFLGGLTEHGLRAPVAYEDLQGQRWEYPLGQTMQHVVNHSSYHRGQVVTLLRQLGRTSPTTDLLVFFDAAVARGSPTSVRRVRVRGVTDAVLTAGPARIPSRNPCQRPNSSSKRRALTLWPPPSPTLTPS